MSIVPLASLTRHVTAAGFASLLVLACGSDREQDDFARIALNPTGSGTLPDAILGTAPPPQGTPLHYVPGDTATTRVSGITGG